MREWVDGHAARWSEELDWLDPVDEAIVARLAILGRYLRQSRREELQASGLAYWEFKILPGLRRMGPPYTASPSQLAELFGLTRGALSARLGPLEDAGLIARTVDGSDRRRVQVRPTMAGHDVFERHAVGEHHGEEALLAPLTAMQRRTLADLLCMLVLSAEPGKH